MKHLVTILIVSLISALVSANSVYAISAPSFPSCLNPQGTVIASYAEGTHGIVGYSTAYSGSDKVYKVTDSTVLQCFCADDGNGIQTNWFKASELSEDEMKSLEAQGWTYIPSGTPWGLDQGPYFAKNSFFNCKARVDGSSSSTGGGSSSSSSSSSSSTGGGSNDIAGKVLGLAFTGSSEYIFNMWLYGLVALTFGVWLKRYTTQKKSSQ